MMEQIIKANEIQYRNLPGVELVQLEESEADGQRFVEGRGVVFDAWTELVPGIKERVDPAVMDSDVWSRDITCCLNHERDLLLGRTGAKTMTIEKRKDGIYYRSEIPMTTYGKDLIALMERGNVYGSSFSFMADPETMEITRNESTGDIEIVHRNFIAVRDISPVYTPQYRQSTVQMRSLIERKEEIERLLEEQEANRARRQYMSLARLKYEHAKLGDFIF